MLPAISLCLVSSIVDNLGSRYWPVVRINGIVASYKQFTTQDIGYYSRMTEDHISILDEKWLKLEDNVKEILLENNEWNHTEITFYPGPSQIGIHVFKGKNSMEDIRFTDPYETDNDDDDVNSDSEFEFNGKKRASSTGNVKGLQEQQQLTSFDQHKLEDCENVNKAKGKGMATLACSSTAGEGNGKNPVTELLSATKESTKNYQSASNGKTVARDQLESEYQVTNPEDQLVSNHESTMSASGCHVVMGLNQRNAKWQSCMCGLFSSLVSLCSSSFSLDSP